jgi:hypothetical protein
VRKQPTNSKEKDPFLYSAFTSKNAKDIPLLLAANELAIFQLQLHNPFSFSVHLEALSIVTSGVPFQRNPIHVDIPAFGSETVLVSGIPEKEGNLKVVGCEFEIFGVTEQCTVSAGSTNIMHPKLKCTAREMIAFHEQEVHAPMPLIKEVPVVPPLPVLHVRSVGTAHKSLVLLEGQKTSLNLLLQNQGNVAATSLKVVFSEEKRELDVNEANPILVNEADTYDLKYMTLSCPSIPSSIPPGETIELKLEGFGKRGVTRVEIRLAYGDGSECFRSLSTFIDVNVLPSVKAVDVFVSRNPEDSKTAFLHLDLSNSHVTPVDVLLCSQEEYRTTIPANATKRCIIAIKKCPVEEEALLASIPALKDKQFVISKHGKLPSNFKIKTMCFWIKRYLLSDLRCTWSSVRKTIVL